MRKLIRTMRPSLCAAAVLLIAACSDATRKHGYVPTTMDLNQITVGVDTKETVADLVGHPTTNGILADSGWYYVESKFTQYGLRDPREVDREVVAISFDGRGRVSNIERFGLEDGRVIALSRRVTDSNIRGISFLRQLFGSIGNFAAENLID